MGKKVKTGLDRLDGEISKWGTVGLVSNASGMASNGKSTLEILRELGADIRILFAPEHGFFSNNPDGQEFEDADFDGLKIVSLYCQKKAPDIQDLQGLKHLIIDLQDLGIRFYTFLSTLMGCLKSADKAGVKVTVLDRPLPRNGALVEGNIPEKFGTFLCPAPVPICYSMTPGEMALWLYKAEGLKNKPHIVELENWNRDMLFEDTGLFWHSPSPAMIGPECAGLYPGSCFIEGTDLSEGRGTPWPFSWVGAPFFECEKIVGELMKLDISDVNYEIHDMIPEYGKQKGILCHGIRFLPRGRSFERPFETGIRILSGLYHCKGGGFEFLTANGGNFFMDSLWGGDGLRKAIIEDRVDELLKICAQQSRDFQEKGKRAEVLIYS